MTERIVLKNIDAPNSHKIDVYIGSGGYQALHKALREMKPDEVTQVVTDSGLRGRGGAGFPTGRKWAFIPKDVHPRYLCCNADEGEPGTFKDRYITERDPHELLEGIAIACYAVGVNQAYIYIRGEFVLAARRLEEAMREAYGCHHLGKSILGSDFDLEVSIHRGAGAYICGEETALIESLEGKRGVPRMRPPFPATYGLYGKPTVVNNVETLANLPHIVLGGAQWYKGFGTERSPGTKIFCLSGDVEHPGVYELPMGTPVRELIYDHGGGVKAGRKLKAFFPGGISTPLLVEKHLDTGLDFESLAQAGSMLGTGAVIVMDESACVVKTMARAMEFYCKESCGKCTPCREGTVWMGKILRRIEGGLGRTEDLDLLLDICQGMRGKTFCPMGDGVTCGLTSSLEHFREEYEHHIAHERCPF